MKGSGTKQSPISLDDSEEEVFRELFQASHNPIPDATVKASRRNGKRRLEERMELGDEDCHDLEGTQVKSGSEVIKRPPKRKRVPQVESNKHSPADPSQSNRRGPAQNVRSQGNLVQSKKARKRQRRLERQALQAEAVPQQQLSNNPERNFSDQDLIQAAQAAHTWATQMMAQSMLQASFPPFHAYASTPSLYPGDPQHDYANGTVPDFASTSPWVSSMVEAVKPPNLDDDSWGTPYNQSEWYQTKLLETPPSCNIPPAVNLEPVGEVGLESATELTYSRAEPLPLPPKPEPPPIGMKPEQDPSSKHGVFKLPPASSLSAPPYIPNPARTLVMEQIPKSYRHLDWVNKWSKKACGAFPVHVSIDTPSAKALIEFATAELARKAWSSPKLGQHLIGMKAHPKGKPREDLIKVWWYRVDGVGAGAGVGEIEEGEIEGEEAEVPVKKETKKERKARLARERLAKQAKLQQTQQTQVQRPPASSPYISIPPPPPFLPLNPTLYAADGTSPYSAEVMGTPLRTPTQTEVLNSATWRDQFHLRKADAKAYGASTDQGAQKDSSIASSRSPSPELQAPDALSAESSKKPAGNEFLEATEVDMNFSNIDHVGDGDAFLPPVLDQMERVRIVSQPQHSTLHTPIPISGRAVSSMAFNHIPVPVISPLISPPPSNSATPPLAPSEPRAMKNLPKGPSFTKRSLLARQKELEERIARTKKELGVATEKALEPTTESTASLVPTIETPAQDEHAMEHQLRLLVLQSKKKVHNAPPLTSSSCEAGSKPLVSPTSSGLVSPPAPDSLATSVTPGGFSLDDLAVTFITETIQTFKDPPAQPIPSAASSMLRSALLATEPTSRPASTLNPKIELAARQQRLEQSIAESKLLMSQLQAATTKQEKDRILVVMRERSRLMEEKQVTTAPSPTTTTATTRSAAEDNGRTLGSSKPPTFEIPPHLPKWPELHHAGILVVSDDEEESDSDEETA